MFKAISISTTRTNQAKQYNKNDINVTMKAPSTEKQISKEESNDNKRNEKRIDLIRKNLCNLYHNWCLQNIDIMGIIHGFIIVIEEF